LERKDVSSPQLGRRTKKWGDLGKVRKELGKSQGRERGTGGKGGIRHSKKRFGTPRAKKRGRGLLPQRRRQDGETSLTLRSKGRVSGANICRGGWESGFS